MMAFIEGKLPQDPPGGPVYTGRSGDCGELFQHVDQPGGGLQDRQPLRQLRAAEGGVEQRERALVGGMPLAGLAERGQPRDQCGTMGFDLVITLAKIRTRRR
jgi:hypothetical protein